MSSETTFTRDIAEGAALRRTLQELSDSLGARLREAGLAGTTVRLKLRWPNFTTITRQTALDQPTDQDGEIYRAAVGLLERSWKAGKPVRLIGVAVAQLGPKLRQLSLFDRTWQADEKLLAAIDSIRGRYGADALRKGRSGRHRGD